MSGLQGRVKIFAPTSVHHPVRTDSQTDSVSDGKWCQWGMSLCIDYIGRGLVTIAPVLHISLLSTIIAGEKDHTWEIFPSYITIQCVF